MKVRGDFLGLPRSTDKTTLIIKVSNGAKIRNRYNQVPHLTQDTNGKVKSLIIVIYDMPKLAILRALTLYIHSDIDLFTEVGVAFYCSLNI